MLNSSYEECSKMAFAPKTTAKDEGARDTPATSAVKPDGNGTPAAPKPELK